MIHWDHFPLCASPESTFCCHCLLLPFHFHFSVGSVVRSIFSFPSLQWQTCLYLPAGQGKPAWNVTGLGRHAWDATDWECWPGNQLWYYFSSSHGKHAWNASAWVFERNQMPWVAYPPIFGGWANDKKVQTLCMNNENKFLIPSVP